MRLIWYKLTVIIPFLNVLFGLFVYMENAVKKKLLPYILIPKRKSNSGFQSGLKFPWTGRRFHHVGQINHLSKLENSGGDPVSQTRIQRRTPKLSYSCQQWDTNAWSSDSISEALPLSYWNLHFFKYTFMHRYGWGSNSDIPQKSAKEWPTNTKKLLFKLTNWGQY